MKPWIIISSGIILSILLLTWVYIYFNGDGGRDGLFNALNFGDTSGEGFDLGEIFDGTTEELAVAELRQLSLRRTAGYVPLPATASSSATAYLVEAGTGHIYTIDIASGLENRVSNITIPSAHQAVLSHDATFAVVAKNDGQGGLTVVSLPHGSTTLDSFEISANAFSFSLTSDNTLLYATHVGSTVIAYAYDLVTRTETTLFNIPFREATIIWGQNAGSVHYAYPRTSSQLEGFLYTIKAGVLGRAPASGYGLSAFGDESYALFTVRSGEGYLTRIYATNTGGTADIGFSFLPEKCAFVNNGALCGLSSATYDNNSPDNWYSGEVSYSDTLWYLDLETKESFFVLDMEATSGRQLDVINPQIPADASSAFFINKTDQSLWVYEGDFISNSSDN